MATSLLLRQQPETATAQSAPRTARPEYRLWGRARAAGPYNSHFVAAALLTALAAFGVVHPALALWVGACLALALAVDHRPLRRKIRVTAIPGQLFLYAQLFAQAAFDALPFYGLAFLFYVCSAHYVQPYNLAVSSFVILYAFYMTIRAYWLVKYLILLTYRWNSAGRTFALREANLRSRSEAIRHVLWAYFLGNIGLIVRCSAQVVTIALFEWLRIRLALDLTQYETLAPHLLTIFVVATALWLATMYWAIRCVLVVFYRTHRTLHTCPALYTSIHAIHHRGVLPTPLDSGTISPAEFGISEMVLPAVAITPNWYFALIQIIVAIAGHWPSHDAGTRGKFYQHHLLHHRHFRVNYGLTPYDDQRFGTLELHDAHEQKSESPSLQSADATRPRIRTQSPDERTTA